MDKRDIYNADSGGDKSSINDMESPSIAAKPLLSQLLSLGTQGVYYPSGRACSRILSWAEQNGKKLSPELENALKKQADTDKEVQE